MLYLIASAVCVGLGVGIMYFVADGGADEVWMNAIAVGGAATLFMTAVITLIAGIVSYVTG